MPTAFPAQASPRIPLAPLRAGLRSLARIGVELARALLPLMTKRPEPRKPHPAYTMRRIHRAAIWALFLGAYLAGEYILPAPRTPSLTPTRPRKPRTFRIRLTPPPPADRRHMHQAFATLPLNQLIGTIASRIGTDPTHLFPEELATETRTAPQWRDEAGPPRRPLPIRPAHPNNPITRPPAILLHLPSTPPSRPRPATHPPPSPIRAT